MFRSEQSEEIWIATEWDISGSAVPDRELQSVSVFVGCRLFFMHFSNVVIMNLIVRKVCFCLQEQSIVIVNDFVDNGVVVGTGIWLIRRWSLSWWQRI